MSRYYNKDELKSKLEITQIYDLLELWGGEPEYTSFGIKSRTICHNPPLEGSRKLYYYTSTKLFVCYTGCSGSFDIFELAIKVAKIQKEETWELYDAMDYIARYFGFEGQAPIIDTEELLDWEVFRRHKFNRKRAQLGIILPEYDAAILDKFSYPRILRWEIEGIKREVSLHNHIGYYPGDNQITIPHYDINNRLVGIRGRTLSIEDGERYGKYRPLLINGIQYSHPLSMNLYNLNNSKDNIRKSQVAILLESEKSCLQFSSFYGYDKDISVACCGSNVSSYHIELLKKCGAKEVVLAFDRQFQALGNSDSEFIQLKKKLINLYDKYNKTIKITAIFDKEMITPYKASPTDCGKEVFEQLLQTRIVPSGR